MKLFDAHIYSETRSDGDLANLAFFEVSRVLICAHAPRPFQTVRDLGQHFERLLVGETERLRRQGIEALVAIGVHPEAVPTRAHHELWRELPWVWSSPGVGAVGELTVVTGGKREWALVERQLKMLGELGLDLPVVFSLPRWSDARRRRGALEKLAALVGRAGLKTGDVLVQHIDWLTIDTAEGLGFWSGLSIHPFFLDTATATRIALHHERRRLIASSALREGPVDILALPKLAVALGEAGLPRGEIERVVYGNAMSLLVRKASA